MIDWDMQDGISGALLIVLGCALIPHNPPLAVLGILGGIYNLYHSFYTHDPDGV